MKHKVVFVTDTLMSGGAERVISVIANALASKYYIEIICLRDKAVFYEIVPSVVIKSLPDCGWTKKFILFRKALRESQPDVVLAFMRNVYEFTILSSLGLGLSIIPCERVDPKIAPFLSKIIRGIVLPFASRFVVQTEEMKDYFRKGIREKTVVISNPVDDKFLGNLVHVDDRKDVIISVGRLSPQKDFVTLIRAFAIVAERHPSYSLVIYGEGPQRNELEGFIDKMGLKNKVTLPGRSNEIYKELSKARVFVQTSKFEGMSNAVIEAICSGLPIVTTEVSGARQMVKEGKNGYIVSVGNVEEVVDRIELLLNNKDLFAAFSSASYSMRESYQIDVISSKWESLINEVICNE